MRFNEEEKVKTKRDIKMRFSKEERCRQNET